MGIASMSLALGDTVSAQLDQPVQENVYTFDVIGKTTLMFEALAPSSDLAWELKGPSGMLYSDQSFSNSNQLPVCCSFPNP